MFKEATTAPDAVEPAGGHSPLPWWIDTFGYIQHSDGGVVMYSNTEDETVSVPDAALIVERVNGYEALVAERDRLREALQFYANPEIYKPHPDGLAFDRRDLSFHARATLSHPTGTEPAK